MALVTELVELKKDNPKIHERAEATYTVFTDPRGRLYIQIDSYGSKERKIPGKISQSLQLGPEALEQLRTILDGMNGRR